MIVLSSMSRGDQQVRGYSKRYRVPRAPRLGDGGRHLADIPKDGEKPVHKKTGKRPGGGGKRARVVWMKSKRHFIYFLVTISLLVDRHTFFIG